jgi:hypothetical protein
MVKLRQRLDKPTSGAGTKDDAGNSRASGNADTNCSDTMVAHYTIVIGEQTLRSDRRQGSPIRHR